MFRPLVGLSVGFVFRSLVVLQLGGLALSLGTVLRKFTGFRGGGARKGLEFLSFMKVGAPPSGFLLGLCLLLVVGSGTGYNSQLEVLTVPMATMAIWR